MPTPQPGEPKETYLHRCIPFLLKEGKTQDQSIAICINMWKEHNLQQEDYVISLYDAQTIEESSAADVVSVGKSILSSPTVISAINTLASNKMVGLVGASVLKDILSPDVKPLSANFTKPDSSYLVSTDTNSSINKFKTRPQGIVISDTVNHPIFPIPLPILDDSKFNLPFIKEQYITYYTQTSVDFLPWHFTIEMIQGKYYAIQTRPIDMKFPISTQMANDLLQKNKPSLSATSASFLQNQPFDLSESIHICLIGDSNRDVYTERLYEMIGRLCSGPYLRTYRLPTKTGQRVINFNLGNKFIFPKLDLYLPR